ncbi:MAG: biotin transporter BioY [Eubacterium sp.]|nr:biotin transporter BioY [Eubacterium sp.]
MKEESATAFPVRQLCFIALMSAVMCLLGPLAVPIGPVPISVMTLTIYLSMYVLGMKMGTVSCMIYLLLGFAGVPVFAGYTGGAAKLLGPTGGYLVGYICLTLVGGFIMEQFSYKRIWCILGMVVGTVVLYAFGTVWFMVLMKCELGYALSACVIPFLIGDLAKIVLAELVGQEIRKRLKAANLIG